MVTPQFLDIFKCKSTKDDFNKEKALVGDVSDYCEYCCLSMQKLETSIVNVQGSAVTSFAAAARFLVSRG